MHNLNIELTAKYLKTLADSNRCITCDKLNVPRVRYPCGHSVCEECVSVAECCLLCITPPTNITHFKDEPLSQRVQHVSELVSAFQDLFGVDVNRVSNISKQLKEEKLLFPECIQAPKKYYNKRKSTNSLGEAKENIKPKIVLPGEEVTNKSYNKMENKNNYVKQWLNNIERPLSSRKHRQPFADLSVNHNQQECLTKESQVKVYRKRKHFKTISNNTEKHNIPQKRNKNEFSKSNEGLKSYNNSNKSYQKKCEANESGIVIVDDDDDVFEIVDSQLEIADKDKLACKAVAEAELNNREACMDLFNDSSYIEKTLTNCVMPDKNICTTFKVPFYRKSFLHKICGANEMANDKQRGTTNFRNVTITVENSSFLTTINVSNSDGNVSISKELSNLDKLNIDYTNPSRDQNEQEISFNVLRSETAQPNSLLLKDVKQCYSENGNHSKIVNTEERQDNVRKAVIINDSDTDSSLGVTEKEKKITVDVHRSCGEADYGVLSALNQNQTDNRSRHARREQTPLSTDSSDKENYDPNRMKRPKHEKKCNQKKSNLRIL